MSKQLSIEHNGDQWTYRDLAEAHGLEPSLLRKRYRDGKRGADLVAPVGRGARREAHYHDWRWQGLM